MVAWTYIAALDVHHARVFGRCEVKNGIAPFDRLVEQVMSRPPYNEARRVLHEIFAMPIRATAVVTSPSRTRSERDRLDWLS